MCVQTQSYTQRKLNIYLLSLARSQLKNFYSLQQLLQRLENNMYEDTDVLPSYFLVQQKSYMQSFTGNQKKKTKPNFLRFLLNFLRPCQEIYETELT